MTLCRINVDGDAIAAPENAMAALRHALAGAAVDRPVVVLIHGYKFSPALDHANPHSHILSLAPERTCRKALSWPRALGSDGAAAEDPVCIALGWEARGSFWQAYGRAAQSGRALADLIGTITKLRPDRPVDVMAHSLGCRVALSALPHLPDGAMGRAILMAPAEMRSRARRLLDCPAGRSVEVLNVTSRANGLYDRMLEWTVAPHRIGDRALGAGLAGMVPNWTDINIDRRRSRDALAQHGYPIARPERRICHWSVYLRPGLFPFYRAVLSREIPLASLRAQTSALAEPRAAGWRRIPRLPGLPVTRQAS